MAERPGGLWQHRDFLFMWTGQTISQLGSQITSLALPLTAALILQATPGQMGLMNAVEMAPFLLVGLFAGVWIDRWRRRPVLMFSDLGRGVLLAVIPAAFLLHSLRIELLYIIAFGTGVLTVFFDVAYQAYLPSLVERGELIEGNTKLEVTRSAAQVAGPGLAGGLMQVVSAPVAICLDSLSFFVSALSLAFIHRQEPVELAPQPLQRPSFWSEAREGLHVVFGSPVLRAIAGCTATSNLFGNIGGAVAILYMTRNLALGPGLLGLIFAAGNVGFLLGALVAGPVARRLGLGRTLWITILIGGIGQWAMPLVGGGVAVVTGVLIAGQVLGSLAVPSYNINQVSLRQAITPQRLQGRMNATMRFIVWGVMPIGSLIGGALGLSIGLRPTLFISAAGSMLPMFWILLSPVRDLQRVPEPVEEPATLAQPAPG